MTARVLVVDDNEANVKLLQTLLEAEYFDVLVAYDGQTALNVCAQTNVDIVLLDVMMPGIDGFEVCRRLKDNPKLCHIPVVMVTALDQPADRVIGLKCGADDFLTKPVNNVQLMARVKSLLRLKILNDELRLRAGNNAYYQSDEYKLIGRDSGAEPGMILLVDSNPSSQLRIVSALEVVGEVTAVSDHGQALEDAQDVPYEFIIINDNQLDKDVLRLCSQLRSQEATRFVPILLVVPIGEDGKVVKALDMGVNDYIIQPMDVNELIARSVTQLRRWRSTEHLRLSLEKSVELAIVDPLTGLNNRHFLDSFLEKLIARARRRNVPISAYITDIDKFKSINDGFGHDAGDRVLKEFGQRLMNTVRSADLVCRIGGEEFLVLMPDTNIDVAMEVAERLRTSIEGQPFKLGKDMEQSITTSVGVAKFDFETDDSASFLKRADEALYDAKHGGRNQTVFRRAS